MKRILLFLVLSFNLLGFNIYDASSAVNEIQQTISDLSYTTHSLDYIKSSVGINDQQKDMDYYRNPDNFKTPSANKSDTNKKQIMTTIFNDSNPQNLADRVNNFIQNREIVDIQFSVTSNVAEAYKKFGSVITHDVDYMYSALIIYRR